jgi:type IX secretion system PorP/SprF family membrane protein
MKRRILVPFLVFFALALEAQQLPLFTQYRENATLINPAAMESDFLSAAQNMTFGVSIRSQWSGISGGPKTKVLRGSYVNSQSSGAAFMAGGHIISDVTGPTGVTGIYGRAGAVISGDPEYSGISLALSGGLVQYKIDANEIRVRDQDDAIATQSYSQLHPDVGFGVYAYQTLGQGNMIYGGISVPQILGLDLAFTDENGDFSVKRVQHFYGHVGLYKFFRDGENFIEPSVWFKYAPNAPMNADFNLRVQLPGSLWVGSGASTAKNFHLDLGFNLGDNVGFDNLLKIGYGYDYSFSAFGPFVGSTHELNLSISFER